MDPSRRPATTTRIERIYYSTGALFTLATSIIWGVNTLFLLDAGLDIFRVMLVNATFSAGQIVFEIPTGVIADTVGRRVSFLLGIGTLMIATLGYVGSSVFGWGLPGFILSSILIGFGYTCQTGAVDAWLVDALDSTGYSGSKDRVFARSGMFNGVSILVGTLGGGLLGQVNLAVPYLVRTGLLLGAFALTLTFMRDIGFQPRPLKVARFGEESRKIFGAGLNHGWRHPVIRPLLFASLVNGLLVWYLFYAMQPYALQLLGRGNLVWVAGMVTALFALSSVAGNSLVGRVSRTRIGSRPATVLLLASAGMALVRGGRWRDRAARPRRRPHRRLRGGHRAAWWLRHPHGAGRPGAAGLHQRAHPVGAACHRAVVRLFLRRCRGGGRTARPGLRGSGGRESPGVHHRRGRVLRLRSPLPPGRAGFGEKVRPPGGESADGKGVGAAGHEPPAPLSTT